MRILMTGGSSFTGRSLVPILINTGCEIFNLVRKNKKDDHDFIWDFSGPLPEEIPPVDILIHLAAYVSFEKNTDFIQYKVNTISTMTLASWAQTGNAYFILASMVGIHGSTLEFVDENSPINPDTPYAVSKYLSEEVVRRAGIPFSILRINGIYGLDGPPHLL